MAKVRAGLVAITIVTLLGGGLPARAGASRTVSMVDFAFDPATVRGLSTNPLDPARDHPIVWRNDGDVNHQVQARPAQEGITMHTAVLGPGESSGPHRLKFAATWLYWCAIHTDSMQGRIRIRPALFEPGDPGDYAVTNGPDGEAIVRLANGDFPSNYRMDVQRRRDGGAWVTIRDHTMRQRIVVTPNAAGEYRFRARVFHLTTGGATGWSPPTKTLTIT
jgi:plastocyanin